MQRDMPESIAEVGVNAEENHDAERSKRGPWYLEIIWGWHETVIVPCPPQGKKGANGDKLLMLLHGSTLETMMA